MSAPNILVSGSGIAGSVFAFWLLRAYPNAAITIVERDPTLRLTGASVDIRSSAVDIIKWMGLEQTIRDQTTKEEGVQFVNSSGKGIATLRASGREDVQSITSEFEIYRGALAAIFIKPIRDRVELIFDESVESYEEQDEGVLVTFSRSKEVRRFDLIVAADGFGSRIRGMMLETKSSEQVFDAGVHVAYFTLKENLLKGGRLAKWYNSTGGRVVFLRPDVSPEGRTRAAFMNVTTKADVQMKDKLNKAIREGNESYMKLMEETYGDVGWLAPEVLKGMRESDDFYCSIFGQIRSPKLHGGHVALVGDAGYATPGIGTSLAIIGGYVLAGELLKNSGDVKVALQRYEDIMLPFVKESQGNDDAMQYLNPQSQWGIGVRNATLGFVTGLRLDRLVMATMSMLGIKEKKVPLLDYAWVVEKK